jgi:hypothetical protein
MPESCSVCKTKSAVKASATSPKAFGSTNLTSTSIDAKLTTWRPP